MKSSSLLPSPSAVYPAFGNQAAESLFSDVKKIAKKINRVNLPDEPVYLFDAVEAGKSIDGFRVAFEKAGSNPQIFFALKSNPYPGLLKVMKTHDVGIDVSSERELEIALKAGAKKIIVTGPAKSEKLFKKLWATTQVRQVYLESDQELVNLKKTAQRGTPPFKVGIRIVPTAYAAWDKFGIPLNALPSFLKSAATYGINITALQFHISYVKDADTHAKAMIELAGFAKKNCSQAECAEISSIDIGGGFTPYAYEADYPWNPEGFSLFDIEKIKNKILSAPSKKRAIFSAPASIEAAAKSITTTWKEAVLPVFPNAVLYTEPGRYLSHRAMHILLRVADKKSDASVILNGGWNMLGWEKYQYISYVPTFNIDNPSTTHEIPCLMYGNLCLPDDVWGYHLHGTKINVGDRILLPYQGAYTYTYRQDFIRGIPRVVHL